MPEATDVSGREVDAPDPEIEARPVAWALLALPAGAVLLLHLLTAGRYGIFRDEYYYLACAARPAWGYVDQPPLSVWMLGVWTWLFGDSVLSIRIPPALCGAGLVLLAGATAAQLGAGRWGQLVGGLGVAVGGATLAVTGFYSMNAFDFLFWLGAYHVVIRAARTGDGKWWIAFGLVVGLGLLNKIGLLVFGAALGIGLLATRQRRHFADARLYAGGALALAFLVPYAIWNALHGWPTLEFMDNATSGKIAAFTPWEYFSETVLEANPLALPVWAGGLLWLALARRARRFRVVALAFVATFAILNLQSSKPYYFASSLPVMVAAGGAAWDGWTSGPRWRWARWVVTTLLIAGGALLAPVVVPVLSPEGTLAHMRRTGIAPAPQEVGHTTPLPQHLSDRLGWENLARVVSEIYAGLPDADREHCVVLGQNYGHAGAIEYWSKRYPLPPAYTTHNNYWFWGPPPEDTELVLVIQGNPAVLRELFEEVVEVGVAATPGAIESSMTIWLCIGPRRPVAEVWSENRSFG